MFTEGQLTPPGHGYLSEDSKRRFTLVAGILGAVFFVAQFLVPMVVMLLFMAPVMFRHDLTTVDLGQAALWRGELWLVERTMRLNWREAGHSATTLALAHVRLEDLSKADPAISLEGVATDSSPTLLPIGDRLWVVTADAVSYYQGGSLTRLSGGTRPHRASQAFAYGGRPAVVSLGTSPMLATLETEGGQAKWTTKDLSLGLSPEAGTLRTLRAVEAGGRLYLFAQVCTEEPERCSISYRALEEAKWLPLVDDACSCANWTPLVLGERPAMAFVERSEGRASRVVIVRITAEGPQREQVDVPQGRMTAGGGRPFALGDHLLLVSEGMPGSLSLAEIADGRVTRSVRKAGSFPFGPNVMLFMMIPQLLPVLLSLILALVLTGLMRRHRVQNYVLEGERRRFASLWQRALAQLVDLVPLGAGFALPVAGMWRLFSDPESFLESGDPRFFPLAMIGLVLGALVCGLLVLVAFSYLEGRYGKTPGKWLLGIRVVGTDLKLCGFGRALLRNVLTFVDGFFNFLVGAMLVALTENWQRLGDLAARTIVVVDEKPA